MTVSIQNLVGLTTPFNANLGNLRYFSPLFEYLRGRIEDALGDNFVQFNAKDLASRLFDLGVIWSSSTRDCSLAFYQSVKSCEICVIDMTMRDISYCRAIDLARNEHARGREISCILIRTQDQPYSLAKI